MKTSRLLTRIAAVLAAGTVVIAADGALAKGNNGGDHGSDHSQMKSHDSGSDHSDKHSENRKDKSGEMHAEKMKEKEAKRAEKMKEKEKEEKHAEKMKDKDKDKDKTGATTTTSANNPPAPGTGGTNTIHPIMSPPPAPGAASPATPVTAIGGGLVRDKLPDGTVYVRRGTSAELAAAGPTGSGKGIVTVSDGKGNSVIIPDHGTGVTVTSGGPGHVTISNGVESRTVSGIALSISGASAVSVDKSLGTGPRQADGSTVVLTPNGTVTGSSDPNALGGLSGFLTGGGFEAHAPAPESGTSTIQQQ